MELTLPVIKHCVSHAMLCSCIATFGTEGPECIKDALRGRYWVFEVFQSDLKLILTFDPVETLKGAEFCPCKSGSCRFGRARTNIGGKMA